MTEENRISRARAARLLKVHPRTIGRMVQDGELRKGEDGLYSYEEVMEYAGAQDGAEEDTRAPIETMISEMVELNKQAYAHNERILQLSEKPIQVAMATLEAINKQALQRQTEEENHKVQWMQMLGELLLQKDQREAVQKEAEAKAQMMKDIGSQIAMLLPVLLEQMAGKSAIKEAGKVMDEAEKAALFNLISEFDSESKKKLIEAFAKAGIQAPPINTEGEPS